MKKNHFSVFLKKIKLKYLLIILIFVLFPAFGMTNENDVTGTWKGNIEVPGVKLAITVYMGRNDDGSLSGTIDIPQQQASGLKLVNISRDNQNITFAIDGIPGNPVFNGEIQTDIISGNFEQGGQIFPFSIEFKHADTIKPRLTEEEFFEKLRILADKSMESWNIPGMAIAIVKKGEIVFAEGFGYRNMEDKLPVTENTQFAIGSTSKAMTALGVAMLVEDGLIDWNEPVRTYLPDFRLYDEVATARLNSIDLLTHRSGLPRHDLFWFGSERSRIQMYNALQYLENSADIRTRFQYQNLMYMTAGVLIERVSGKTWEEFTADRIFKPLGMNNSNFSVTEMQKVPDFSYPYMHANDETSRIPFRNIDAVGPAGSVNSSIKDMTQWLKFLLAKGKAENKQIVETSTVNFLFLPQITMSGETGHTQYAGYGLGWMIEFFRGKRHFYHGGGIDGFITQVGLLPDADTGYIVFTNNAGNSAGIMIGNYILDYFYDLDPLEWSDSLLPSERSDEESKKGESPEDSEPEETRIKGTSASFAPEDYAGIYSNKGYGKLKIKYENGMLRALFNSNDLTMEHWHFDVFKVRYEFMPESSIMLQFEMNMDGNITGIKVPLEASVSPVVFKREPDKTLSGREYLEKFTGSYAFGEQISNFRITGNRLRLSIAGQPLHTLEPVSENEFRVEGIAGIRISFKFEDGEKASKVIFRQPNGLFESVRIEK